MWHTSLMRIKEALSDIKDLVVEFPGGGRLNIKYRPSSYTVADLSDIDEEAKKDPYRIITMIRDMVIWWDLEDNSGEPIALALPPGTGNVITSDGEQVRTKFDKKELLKKDPIAREVPITLLVGIIRAVNEDQSAGN